MHGDRPYLHFQCRLELAYNGGSCVCVCVCVWGGGGGGERND